MTKTAKTLDAISKIESENDLLGVCFSKVADFPPQAGTDSLQTADVADLVRDCMITAVEALDGEPEKLEPQVEPA